MGINSNIAAKALFFGNMILLDGKIDEEQFIKEVGAIIGSTVMAVACSGLIATVDSMLRFGTLKQKIEHADK